jgi:hypothetical protein
VLLLHTHEICVCSGPSLEIAARQAVAAVQLPHGSQAPASIATCAGTEQATVSGEGQPAVPLLNSMLASHVSYMQAPGLLMHGTTA